jgi:hypothetical protein
MSAGEETPIPSSNLFLKKIHFLSVEYLKECRGRDLNTNLMAKNIGFLLLATFYKIISKIISNTIHITLEKSS